MNLKVYFGNRATRNSKVTKSKGCSSLYAIEKIINIDPPLTTNIAKKYLATRKNHGAIKPSYQSNQKKTHIN
jgi:hypothetical protein